MEFFFFLLIVIIIMVNMHKTTYKLNKLVNLVKKNIEYITANVPILVHNVIDNKKELGYNIYFLKEMLQGSEDHSIGFINDNIIYFFGFSSGFYSGSPIEFRGFANPENHTRGFYDGIYKYSIKENNWDKIGKVPINTRQECGCITLGNIIYSFGGFSYTPLTNEQLYQHKINNVQLPSKSNIATYSDSIGITLVQNTLKFIYPPNLPYPLLGFGLVDYPKENKIFFLNGALYDIKSFNTTHKIRNNTQIGKSFFYMKYDNNYNILPDVKYLEFVGSPRFGAVTKIVGDFIYIMSGTTVIDTLIDTKKGYNQYTLNNVLDNWKYDIINNKWIKISDLPIPYVNQSSIVYKHFIILFGGHKYSTSYNNNEIFETNTINDNGITTERHNHRCCPIFSNLILIYNTLTDEFNFSNVKLPGNINKPVVISDAEFVYIVGGEMNPKLISQPFKATGLENKNTTAKTLLALKQKVGIKQNVGIYYGNCSSLFIKIKITDILK